MVGGLREPWSSEKPHKMFDVLALTPEPRSLVGHETLALRLSDWLALAPP
jgi:hypothetical protein